MIVFAKLNTGISYSKLTTSWELEEALGNSGGLFWERNGTVLKKLEVGIDRSLNGSQGWLWNRWDSLRNCRVQTGKP